MPAPPASALEQVAGGFVKAAHLLGEDAPGMAKAVAEATSQALALFLAQAMVLPGTPAALDPITGSGATVGPGRLLPPPAGGPAASQIDGLATAALAGQGIRGEDAGGLAKAIAGAITQGITLFCAQAMALPGIPVAGFSTAGPGMLAPASLAGPLGPVANALLQQNGLRGDDATGLGRALAQSVDASLALFAGMTLVQPGTPAAPGATAGPSRLV